MLQPSLRVGSAVGTVVLSLPQTLQQDCRSPAAAGSELAWPSLGGHKLSGMPLPHLATFGVPWQSMGCTKPCTMCSFPTTSPSLGSSPFCTWESIHGGTLIPDFLLSELFSSIIPAERAGLVNMLNRKWDHAFEGHWPSLLVLVSCSKQESSCTWTTRRWEEVWASWIWC